MFKKVIACIVLLAAMAVSASAEPRNFAVLPFTVHGPQEYQYLSKGIQSMLTTRLTWPEHFAPMDAGVVSKTVKKLPASEQAARTASQDLGADYMFWGDLTIVGTNCNLDINAMDLAGANQPRSIQTTLTQLIPELEKVAKQMNAQIFGRSEAAPAAVQEPQKTVVPMNQGMVVNETQANTAYANPSLKYADVDATMGRWRSQTFPFASRGMVVCDGDGDGRNEVFVLSDSELYAYHVNQGRMEQIAQITLPRNINYVRLNSIDINRDGHHELVIGGAEKQDPRSMIISFNGKFAIEEDRIPFYLGVLNMPPSFAPTLVGQDVGRIKYLDSKIYLMTKSQGQYTKGPAYDLPQGGNVYNTTFLPAGSSYQIIMIDDSDHMRVFNDTGTLLTVTEEAYAGSNLGIEHLSAPIGLSSKSSSEPADKFFIPLRAIPANLDKDNRYELIVSRNMSVASQFFSNYRDYPQGEIHSLYWDGVGMSLQWKTIRLKATIADYALTDMDNDGTLDLVVNLNSHTGMAGTVKKRTFLVAYPLNLSQTDPAIQKTEQ